MLGSPFGACLARSRCSLDAPSMFFFDERAMLRCAARRTMLVRRAINDLPMRARCASKSRSAHISPCDALDACSMLVRGAFACAFGLPLETLNNCALRNREYKKSWQLLKNDKEDLDLNTNSSDVDARSGIAT